jgi:hypothetical protein
MEFFRKGLEESITLPSPLKKDEDEIQEVRVIVANRTAVDVKSVMDHDRVPFYAIRVYCQENGLVFHDNEFEDIIYQATPIINHFKNMFNRRRPIDMDSTLNTLPSSTNKTPSYPSGHSTQSRIVARYVAGKFPEHERELIKKGNECGMGRVQAGFHYPTDNEIGNLLGEKMYFMMNKANYEQ